MTGDKEVMHTISSKLCNARQQKAQFKAKL